jgi:hypothetical protein
MGIMAQAKNFCQAVSVAMLAVVMLAACHDKGTLEGSRVEYVRVDGRRFEVRVAPADVEGEFRMLVVRAAIVLNPNPEAERSRAENVAKPFMERSCGAVLQDAGGPADRQRHPEAALPMRGLAATILPAVS